MDWHKQAIAVALSVASASAALADTPGSSTRRAPTTQEAPAAEGSNEFINLSLEQLLNVDVSNAVGLTASDARQLPVDMTQLDSRDIQESGAKDLNQLLEDYVPNAQIIDHHTPGLDLGFRGIISDREDKFLYQVDGVTLNNRLLYGANDERDLPLMGDINTVSVVTGPASATHGSGALAGVVDTETYNGLTFQGADATVRQGGVDQYTATEFRFGHQFNPTSGVFIYYGVADVEGADAPYYIGKSYPAANGLPANVAGQPADVPKANLGQAAFDYPWQKLHVSYVDGPLEIWTRYVEDGTDTQPRRDIYTDSKPATDTLEQWTDGRPIATQQSTTTARYKKDISPDWNLELLQSFDAWLAKDQREGVTVGVPVRHSYEDQLFSRAIAVWTPSDAQSLAIGTEYSHIWFHDPPQSDALDVAPVVTERYWDTDTISFLAEEQWKIDRQWTAFLSLRTDKNTFSNWLLSPRGTLVYMPTKNDTFKVLAGQAVRRADDEDLWGEWARTGTFAKPETLTTYELSYDRNLTDQTKLGANGFYENYNAIGWSPSELSDIPLGNFQIAGGELVLTYNTRSTRVTLSEGVSTLIHASVPPGSPPASQGITSSPYGFGNELAAWAPSITKLAIIQDIGKRWTVSTSVVYYSGFPGAKDYAEYDATLAKPPSGVPLSDPGYNTPYGPNLYWNLGLEYRPTQQLTIRLDGYNIIALFDPTLSKRNYILRESEFSVQPASVALMLRYQF
jgi:iron complex outermembrane receptor protein